MSLKLRPWQSKAVNKALDWLLAKKKDKRFLINAAPGTGKTICASVIAKELFDKDQINRVIVIAPRKEVVNQWRSEFKIITKRSMLKVTGKSEDLGLDICATWNSVQSSLKLFNKICKKDKVLVICDEHHHAAINAVWGASAENAFENSKYVIVLTGTPIRTDGNKPVWFSYTERGDRLEHDPNGTFIVDYGEAVDLKYCRPIFFHRHEGKFSVQLKDNKETINVSGKNGVKINSSSRPKKLISSLQKSLDFYTLARSPQYKADGRTPDLNSYQASMLEWGVAKLDELKYRLPNAGGLVIAPNIPVAEHMASILEILTKQKPILVHSKKPNSDDLIEAYRNSKKDWIVSVAMVSEGVDIKRLRLLVYLPNSLTELFFRQAMGRVVRSLGDEDDSRAYVVMPAFKTFENYARRVESEMKPVYLKEDLFPKSKKCPSCNKECKIKATKCDYCEFDFEKEFKKKKKKCSFCGFENEINAEKCISCQKSFGIEYTLSLNEALRMGGIARQMDISEDEVKDSEKHFENIRKEILESGDARMIEALGLFPGESLIKLKKILNKITD